MWLIDIIHDLRHQGMHDNWIRIHIQQVYGLPSQKVDRMMAVDKAKSERVLDN